MFNVKKTKNDIVEWIKKTVGDCHVVIGISGGKDSSICAALCVEALGVDKVHGVLLPCGIQKDMDKAYELVRYLGIAYSVHNIKSTYEEINTRISQTYIINDCYSTNTPARIRMTYLYGVAACLGNARVCNTCNKSEDWVGYSTKYGDSAGDFAPIADLTVREVKALGYELGLPQDLIEKIPDDGMSGKSDEEKLGFTYAELDEYITSGKIENLEHKEKIDRMHKANLHKLQLIPKFEKSSIEETNYVEILDDVINKLEELKKQVK